MPSFLCEIKAHLMFRLFMQWTENYVCGEVDMVELWEQAVVAANRLIKGEGDGALRVSNWFFFYIRRSFSSSASRVLTH